jgi:serine/threonine protein kinase
VVALSPRALESHWVRAEVHWAVDRRQGRIVPILLDACDPTALHLKLSQIQYVDFTTPSDNARRKLLASWGIAYQPLPRTAVESAQRMREAIASDPPPPRQIVLSLPAELERICLKCLAKQPDQRYQTASDLGHDLRRWLAT